MGQCISRRNQRFRDQGKKFSEDVSCEAEDAKVLSPSSSEAARAKELYLAGIKAGTASLKLADKLALAEALTGGSVREDRSLRPVPERSTRHPGQAQSSGHSATLPYPDPTLSSPVPTNSTTRAASVTCLLVQPRANSPGGGAYSRAASGCSALQGATHDSLRRINSIGGLTASPLRNGGGSRRGLDDAAAVINATRMLGQSSYSPSPGLSVRAPSLPLQLQLLAHHRRASAVQPGASGGGAAVRPVPVAHISGSLSPGAASDGYDTPASGGMVKLMGLRTSMDKYPHEQQALSREGSGWCSPCQRQPQPHSQLLQQQQQQPSLQHQQNCVCSSLSCEGPVLVPAPATWLDGGGGGDGAPSGTGGGGGGPSGGGGVPVAGGVPPDTWAAEAGRSFYSQTILAKADECAAGGNPAEAPACGDGDGAASPVGASSTAAAASAAASLVALSGGSLPSGPSTRHARKFLPRWSSQTRPSVHLTAQPKRPALKGTTTSSDQPAQPHPQPRMPPSDHLLSPISTSGPLSKLDWASVSEQQRRSAAPDTALLPLGTTRGSGTGRPPGHIVTEFLTAPGCADLVTPFRSELQRPSPHLLEEQLRPSEGGSPPPLELFVQTLGGSPPLSPRPDAAAAAAVVGGSSLQLHRPMLLPQGPGAGTAAARGSGGGGGGGRARSSTLDAKALMVHVPEILVLSPSDSPYNRTAVIPPARPVGDPWG